MRVVSRAVWFALFAVTAWAANLKLYLKDGGFHVVREYQVQGDNVHYYSVERSDWEDIPLAMVDLVKTRRDFDAKTQAREADAEMQREEDQALRQQLLDIKKIPRDPGVYCLDGASLQVLPQATSKVHTSKGRSVLKAMSPIPLVSGKGAVELDGEHAATALKMSRPEFYIQLSAEEQFGIIKLAAKGGMRIAERLTFVPIVKEVVEEVDEVPIFRKQLTESDLFKIWPEKDLEPGEYAVIQYTPGKLDAQMWDFAYRR